MLICGSCLLLGKPPKDGCLSGTTCCHHRCNMGDGHGVMCSCGSDRIAVLPFLDLGVSWPVGWLELKLADRKHQMMLSSCRPGVRECSKDWPRLSVCPGYRPRSVVDPCQHLEGARLIDKGLGDLPQGSPPTLQRHFNQPGSPSSSPGFDPLHHLPFVSWRDCDRIKAVAS